MKIEEVDVMSSEFHVLDFLFMPLGMLLLGLVMEYIPDPGHSNWSLVVILLYFLSWGLSTFVWEVKMGRTTLR